MAEQGSTRVLRSKLGKLWFIAGSFQTDCNYCPYQVLSINIELGQYQDLKSEIIPNLSKAAMAVDKR